MYTRRRKSFTLKEIQNEHKCNETLNKNNRKKSKINIFYKRAISINTARDQNCSAQI